MCVLVELWSLLIHIGNTRVVGWTRVATAAQLGVIHASVVAHALVRWLNSGRVVATAAFPDHNQKHFLLREAFASYWFKRAANW